MLRGLLPAGFLLCRSWGGRQRQRGNQAHPWDSTLWHLPACLASLFHQAKDSLATPSGRAGQCHSGSLRPAKNSGAGEKCSRSHRPGHQTPKPATPPTPRHLEEGADKPRAFALALLLERMWNFWQLVVTCHLSGKHSSRTLTHVSEVACCTAGGSQGGSNARQFAERLEQPGPFLNP